MADIEFYKATVSEFDPSQNGGDMTSDLIESGVAHSLILPVRPAMAEDGGERYFKFYAKATVDLMSLGFCIATPTTSPTEDVYLFEAGSDSEVESDLDKANLRVYGAFVVTAYDSANKKVTADRDVSSFVKSGDKVTFFDSDKSKITSWVVDTVNANEITFTAVSSDDVTNTTASSTILLDNLTANAHKGLWIKQVVGALTQPMEDPLDEFILAVYYDVV